MNIRVNTSLDDALVKEIDTIAEELHLSRSALMTVFLQSGINGYAKAKEVLADNVLQGLNLDYEKSNVSVEIPFNKIGRKTKKEK